MQLITIRILITQTLIKSMTVYQVEKSTYLFLTGTMSGGGKTVCKGRMGSSVVSDVDTKDLANNETKLKKVINPFLTN